MKRWIVWPAVFLFLALAGSAQAITVAEVVGLTRAEANDAVIMAKIDADGTVFRLTVDDILELKEAGVSNAVITYMINTGKLDFEPEVVEEVPESVEEPQEEYVDAGGGGDVVYVEDLDNQYRTSYGFSVGLGYYYPHWSGFNWSYYYDPFYWTSWPFYFAYWQPYPYYSWYYDPWYYCNSYNYGYYNSWYGGHYYSHHHQNYYGHDGSYYAGGHKGGRNVGNRGKPDARRVIKDPGTTASARRTTETSYKQRTPKSNMTSNIKQPDYTKTKVRSSRGRSQKVNNQRPARVIRSTPAPAKQVRSSTRSNRGTVRSAPSKQKITRNSPAPSKKVKTSKAPSSRKTVSHKSPAPTKVKAAPSRGNVRSGNRSSSRASTSRGSSSSRGGSRSRKP